MITEETMITFSLSTYGMQVEQTMPALAWLKENAQEDPQHSIQKHYLGDSEKYWNDTLNLCLLNWRRKKTPKVETSWQAA